MWGFLGFLCAIVVAVNGASNYSQVPTTGLGVFPSLIQYLASPSVNVTLVNLPVTLQMRTVNYASFALYEAWSKYTNISKGFLTLGKHRRPVSEQTPLNQNVAIAFSFYRVLLEMHPELGPAANAWMGSIGLDITDTSTDLTTAVGIGNYMGELWANFTDEDGLNQNGSLGINQEPIISNWKRRFGDYTNAIPANTAYSITNATRWQPLIETDTTQTPAFTNQVGYYYVQVQMTPQVGWGYSVAYNNSKVIAQQFPGNVAKPLSTPTISSATPDPYRTQAQEILTLSAALTDNNKVTAEFFDNKFRIIGETQGILSATTPGPISHQIPWNLEDFLVALTVTDFAAYSSAVVAWRAKHVWDYIRPASAIHYLFGTSNVTAWAGPYGGTKKFPGNEFRSYLRSMQHPEYPSGTTCLCASVGRARQVLFGSDVINPPLSYPFPPGSSIIEPGLTPVNTEVVGPFSSWTNFTNACGFSRQLAGVHFAQSVNDSLRICPQIGESAYNAFFEYYLGLAKKAVSPDDREIFSQATAGF